MPSTHPSHEYLQAMIASFTMELHRFPRRTQTGIMLWMVFCLLGCTDDGKPEVSVKPSQIAQETIDSRELLIGQSQSEMKANRPENAAKALRQLLVNDPNDAEVLFRLANIEAQLGRLDEAIGLLESIAPDHPQAGIPSLGQTADWCIQLGRYDDAESKYLELVKRMPDEVLPHRQLATLLNRQGRRHEAAVHIQQLCRLGDVRQDELNALLSLSDAVFFPNESPDDKSTDQIPIGPMGLARWHFTERRYSEAVETLRPLADTDTPCAPTVLALYGRSLAESQNQKEYLLWLAKTGSQTHQCAEYWAALGAYSLDESRPKEAIRALGEALRRDATDIRSARRMYQALLADGQNDIANQWLNRFQDIKETTVQSKRVSDSQGQDAEAFVELAKTLERLNRPLEAVMWTWLGNYYASAGQAAFATLKTKQRSLAKDEQAFGNEDSYLCGMKLELYPLPSMESASALVSPSNGALSESSPVYPSAFENCADGIGMQHTYYTAVHPKDRGFPIYQSLGGGCAVVDFDLDGKCDLYWAQGSADPPRFQATRSDMLYRQVNGRVWDVSAAALVSDHHYTLGVTVGDWNQDGFPDLVAANIGANVLWINNGDGTFAAKPLDAADDLTLLSTSLAMADINQDSLPDLFEVNYIHDATLAKQPSILPDGSTEIVAPLDFVPAMDRVQLNDGQGGRVSQAISQDPDQRGTGLGVVVCNFDDRVGNEVFVGNDVRRDQLWRYTEAGTFENIAPILGCALGNEGSFTASMGIASGDFDGSQSLDMFITNFEKEAASLFLNRSGMFQERSVLYKLAGPTIPLVGFGTQAMDYDNDGDLDLVVTNGHVENTGKVDQPFQQPAQLFVNRGDYFELQKVVDPSGYMSQPHVGRALAVLDYNCDGKTDWIVNHVNEPSAVMLNRTDTPNHWLRFHLVGTRSERDAIGARVELKTPSGTVTRWLTAGDGYLARNEQVVTFGLGPHDKANSVTITWPDGSLQSWDGVSAKQSLLVIEGQDDYFAESYEANVSK